MSREKTIKNLLNYLNDNWVPILFIGLQLVLWDTKGILNSQKGFSFSLFFLTVFFIMSIFIQTSEKSLSFKKVLLIISIQILIQFISIIHKPHSNFNFASVIRDLTIYNGIITITLIVWFGYLFLELKNKSQSTKVLLIFLSILLVIGSLMSIYVAVDPKIDTYLFIKMASNYFLNGYNPYQFTYPDMYQGHYAEFYGKVFYFNYWPFTLYFSSLSQLLFSDVRYILAIFNIGLAFFIWYQNKTKIYLLLGLLWVSNIVIQLTYIQCWIDAFAPFLMFLGMYYMSKQQLKKASFLIGLLAAVKLYYIFVIPVFIIYIYKNYKSQFFKIFISGFVGFIFTFIPFLIADATSFYNSTFLFIKNTKIRTDSLSYLSYIKLNFNQDLTSVGTVIMLSLIFIILIIYYVKNQNNIIQFLKYVILIFFPIFLFSKQSFYNYYFYIISLYFIVLYFQINPKSSHEFK